MSRNAPSRRSAIRSAARKNRSSNRFNKNARFRRLLHEQLEDRRMLSFIPNDPLFTEQWGLDDTGQSGGTFDADIDAPAAWSVSTGDTSIIVAVIDTGVNYTHEDLYLNIWLNQGEIPPTLASSLIDTDADGMITYRDLNQPVNAGYTSDLNATGYIDAGDLISDPVWSDGVDTDGNGYVNDISGYDFLADTADPGLISSGHGTTVSRILASAGNNGTEAAGVCWTAPIMPLRFHDGLGNGSVLDGAEAIDYAVANGAKISNNSWGAPGWPSDAGKGLANPLDIVFHDGGKVYVSSWGTDEVRRYDSTTGAFVQRVCIGNWPRRSSRHRHPTGWLRVRQQLLWSECPTL